MTSPPFWLDRLQQTVSRLQKVDRHLRVAVVGIGHELCGDDIAGMAVARGMHTCAGEHLLVIEGGAAPENQTGRIRQFAPDLVVLVDAAHLDAPPGAIRWLDWRATTGVFNSTHTLPVEVLAYYLTSELDCHIALIGIQPADVRLDAPVTPQVAAAVASVVQGLKQVLSADEQDHHERHNCGDF